MKFISHFAERGLDLVALVLTHQAMVNEHAGELFADGLGQQCGGHGGIDAAGECEQHLAVADLRAYLPQ